MASGYAAPVIVGLAAGIGFIVILVFIIPSLPPAVTITSNMIEINDKQVSLDKRVDVQRNTLTKDEQKFVRIALSDNQITNILKQKDGLYIVRITQGEAAIEDNACQLDCAQVVIEWQKPETSSLIIYTEKESIKHALLDGPIVTATSQWTSKNNLSHAQFYAAFSYGTNNDA